MNIHTAAVLAAGGAMLVTHGASASHIDLFTEAPFFLNGGETIVVAGSEDTILGGQRRVSVDVVQANASVASGGNVLEFNSVGTAAATLTLDYGSFPGGDPLNADFASEWAGIAVDFAQVLGGGLLTVRVQGGGTPSQAVQTFVNAAGTYAVPFTHPGFAGVDFADVDRVTITLSGDPGSDFQIGAIVLVVPAPGGFAGLALAGLVVARRRR